MAFLETLKKWSLALHLQLVNMKVTPFKSSFYKHNLQPLQKQELPYAVTNIEIIVDESYSQHIL